jgi:rhodanese-related sulfurtransferase
MGGRNIPLYSLLSQMEEVPHDKTVVIHCRSGARSASAIVEMERRHNYTNLYNLKGGILAWAKEVDTQNSK